MQKSQKRYIYYYKSKIPLCEYINRYLNNDIPDPFIVSFVIPLEAEPFKMQKHNNQRFRSQIKKQLTKYFDNRNVEKTRKLKVIFQYLLCQPLDLKELKTALKDIEIYAILNG